MLQTSTELRVQPLLPAVERTPRLVMSVMDARHAKDPRAAPAYAACPVDEAWLERLRALRRLVLEHDLSEIKVDQPGLVWSVEPGDCILASELVIRREGFFFQGLFAQLENGLVPTDKFWFGHTDVAIELMLLAREDCASNRRSISYAESTALMIEDCSIRNVLTCLLQTGDLYAGAPEEYVWVEEELMIDERAIDPESEAEDFVALTSVHRHTTGPSRTQARAARAAALGM